jgi:O-antigen/teichoic acid export membrane protein
VAALLGLALRAIVNVTRFGEGNWRWSFAMSHSTPAPSAGPDVGLTARTVRGARWTLLGTLAAFGVQLPYTAAISRLLSPHDFGLVALAMLMLRLVSYFAQGGLSSAVVQRPILEDDHIRASFALGLLAGCAGYVVFWLLAPLGGIVFHSQELTPVARALGVSFLVSAIGSTSVGLLRRSMRYRSMAIIDLGSYVIGYCGVGLTLALLGEGVWSLVWASIAQAVTLTAASYVCTRHSLRPLFRRRAMGALAQFGAKVSAIGFLEFLGSNLDNAAAGRYLGTATLGQYNRAWLVTSLPLGQVATSMSKVLFPAFSRLQHEPARLRQAYVDSMAIFTLVLIPIAAVIGAAAKNGVHVVLGDQWGQAAGLVPILAVASTLSLLAHLPAVIAEATGNLWQKVAIQSLQLVSLGIGIALAVALGGGIRGLAVAALVAQALQHLLYVGWFGHLIKGSLPSVLSAHLQATGIGAAVFLVVAVVGHVLMAVTGPALSLAGQVLAAGLVAISLLRFGTRFQGIQVVRERQILRLPFTAHRRVE